MIYAKVDSEGNVIKYPIRVRPLQPVPGNCVLIDTDSKRPSDLKWYQSCWYDKIEREGDKYVMTYIVKNLSNISEEQLKSTFISLFDQHRKLNEDLFSTGKITKEQFDKNTNLLDLTNFDDPKTYELIEKLEFQ